MHTLDLYIPPRRYRFTGPSTWSELTPLQRIGLMRLMGRIEKEPSLIFLGLMLLFGMKRRHLRWLFDERFLRYKRISDENRILYMDQGQALLELLTFVSQPDPKATFLPAFRWFDFRFGSPLTWLKQACYRRRYLAPQAALSDCTFGEFMWADKAFRDNDLALLTAVLYRPAEAGSTTRQVFDLESVEARTHQFSRLDPAILASVRHSFVSTLHVLKAQFPFVFRPAQPAESKSASAGWLDVALSMAKFDPTQIASLEQTSLYLVLRALNLQLKQDEEQERELAKLKSTSR